MDNIEEGHNYDVGSVMTIMCDDGLHFLGGTKSSSSRKYNCTENGWIELEEGNT